MANTKIPSELIADNSVGIDALNVTDGTNGQYLQTDGAGTLSFSTVSGYTDSDVATYLGGGNTINIDTQGTIKLDGNYPVGTGNVALGDGALSDGSFSGSYNTAIGTSALSSSEAGNYQTAIGFEALKNTNYTANAFAYNTAVGYQAGVTNTTGKITAVGAKVLASNTTGINNAGFGGETDTFGAALQDNTTGSYNSAFGYNALHSNTTAGYQTAVGYNSLATANGGLENTALGANTLSLTSTGSYNTAIGTTAMYGNTTGSYNVAVGRNALDANTTASRNSAVGYSALGANTTGAENTAVGYNALTANTTGNRNVAVGDVALDALTTGSGNVAIGQQALGATTTGIQNVAIGELASINQITGSNNVFIGYNARGTSTATTHGIGIGHNIVNVGDNYVTLGKGAGADRIYALFTSSATWTKASDLRYKEEITNTDCGLDFINDLRPVTYKWKPRANIDSSLPDYNPNETERRFENKMYGLIAQEVKQAMDNNNITDFAGWHETSDGIQGISQEMFVHPLIKAVQELSAKCDSLQNEINILKGD